MRHLEQAGQILIMKGCTSCRRFGWLQVNFSYGHLAFTRYGSGYDRNGSFGDSQVVLSLRKACGTDEQCGGERCECLHDESFRGLMGW